MEAGLGDYLSDQNFHLSTDSQGLGKVNTGVPCLQHIDRDAEFLEMSRYGIRRVICLDRVENGRSANDLIHLLITHRYFID